MSTETEKENIQLKSEVKKLSAQLSEFQRLLIQTQKKLGEQKKTNVADENVHLRNATNQLENERKLKLQLENELKDLNIAINAKNVEIEQLQKQLEEERFNVEIGIKISTEVMKQLF